jgi:phi13 family phage major tail protein
VVGAINAIINPTVNSQELYADDQLWDSVSALGKIEVEIETAELSLTVRAKLGGHSIEDGVLIEKSTDTAPHLALGFKSLKANGKYRFVWLLKGVAQPMAEDFSTKTDNVEHKTPKLKLTFMPRANDEEWKRTADEDEEDFIGKDSWFEEVPGAAPVITILSQTEEITVTEGNITEEIEVEAVVTGSVDLSYQWYSNLTATNSDGTLIVDATTANFTIPTDLTADSYYYYCIISAEGAENEISEVVTVTVEGI